MSWSPGQYLKFEDERTRPARDLLAAIPQVKIARAIDIGCGPGNSTELLKARFPDAEVGGLDNSPEMIAAARKRLPDLDFQLADIAAWSDPGPFDVIFSNAVLQWVRDQEHVLPRLLAKLAAGGCLAVQIPDNHDEPAHRLMREAAGQPPWAETLAPVLARRSGQRSADFYYRLLSEHASAVDVWRTTYHHRLAEGPGAVVEWFKSTSLQPYLDPLGPAQREGFLARYLAAVTEAYPPLPDGAVLLAFPRLFFIAIR